MSIELISVVAWCFPLAFLGYISRLVYKDYKRSLDAEKKARAAAMRAQQEYVALSAKPIPQENEWPA